MLTVQALVHSRNRHDEDAVRTLNEAIRLDKKNDFALLQRGRLYFEMGKTSKAESDLRQASALGNPEAKKLLASMSGE